MTLKMYLTLNSKMAASPEESSSTVKIIAQFLTESWPMILAMFSVWQVVDSISKYYAKKQDVRLRELIQAEVTPQITNLTQAINELREEIGRLKK